MALTFMKKVTNGAGTAASPVTTNNASLTQKTTAAVMNGVKKLPSFMKTGGAAKNAIAQADALAEKAKAESGKLWRFWMPAGEDRLITFLDGLLDDEGMLDVPMFYEHKLKINGEWDTFVCVGDQEPCPICETGDVRQTLVGALTICDHTPHTIQRGPNAGKVIKNSRKLFVPTRQTLKMLSKQAKATKGLVGCTFEVNRTGDKEPSVGNQFIFQEQHTLPELAKKYGLKLEDVQPADYNTEITYHTAEELVKLGLGKALAGPGTEKKVNTSSLQKEL